MAYFRNVALNIEDFDSQEDYSRALLEQERIQKILTNVDITDAHIAKQLYEGFNQHPEMFRSRVGLEFMDVLKENSKEDDKPVESFVYDSSDEDKLDDVSADNEAEAEAIREESELMKPDNPKDMQQHNTQADVTVESKEEAESDVESTDTAEITENTPVEESEITSTDTAETTEDIPVEEYAPEEKAPERSEPESVEESDVEPTDTTETAEDTPVEESASEEKAPEESKQVTADVPDGKTDSIHKTVKNNPARSNLIQNNPVQNNTSQSNNAQPKLTQANFTYAGLIKWIMVLYLFIIICFPMAGAILAGICALAAFIKVWGSYINNKMKAADIFKSLLCIVIFPVGLILSVLGIMKKIKYVYYNRKAILYGCIMYMIPILFFFNIGIFSKNNIVSLVFPVTKAFLDAAVLAKIGIVLDIIFVSVMLIIAALAFAKRLIIIIQSYIDKGLTQNEAMYFVISLPIVMICMFKTFIDGKVLFEDKL